MEITQNVLPNPIFHSVDIPVYHRSIRELLPNNWADLDPTEFFRKIIQDIIDNVMTSSEDAVEKKYINPEDPYWGDFRMMQVMKKS